MVAPHSERFALRAEDSVAAVIVTHRRADQLRHSLELVANQSKPVSHVIVVDNGQEQAVQEAVQELPPEFQAAIGDLRFLIEPMPDRALLRGGDPGAVPPDSLQAVPVPPTRH